MGEEITGAIKYLLIALLSILGWNLRRQIYRIDKIEDNYTSQKSCEEIKKAIADGIKEVRDDVETVHIRIDKILMNQANHNND